MKLILALVAASAALLLVSASASADRVKPYITVAPATPVAPSSFTLSGCGYKTGDAYATVWHNPATGGYLGPGTLGVTQETIVGTDTCLSFTYTTTAWGSDLAAQRGDYEVTVTQDRGSIGVNYLVYVFHVE